jgi:hypothetical protein
LSQDAQQFHYPQYSQQAGLLHDGERRVALTFDVIARSGADGRLEVAPSEVILGGYSARSAEERDRHIEELRAIGIHPPAEVPAFWRVARHLLTMDEAIEVQGDQTSGEAEFALIFGGGETFVTVASDQTDRELERISIPRSKQLCPKVLCSEVVRLEDIRDRWDDIELSSDVSEDGVTWVPYQRSRLSALMDPDSLTRAAGLSMHDRDGLVLLSGTIPLIDGVTRFLSHFRAAIAIPGGQTLRLVYRVNVLAPVEAATSETPA